MSGIYYGKPGDADVLDAPGVREVAGALLAERRRTEREEDYLTQLQRRIAEEGATDPSGPTPW